MLTSPSYHDTQLECRYIQTPSSSFSLMMTVTALQPGSRRVYSTQHNPAVVPVDRIYTFTRVSAESDPSTCLGVRDVTNGQGIKMCTRA
jgi:hypothetical protein